MKATWQQALDVALAQSDLVQHTGRVTRIVGLLIESEGPHAYVGELCEIETYEGNGKLLAEVVGLKENRLLLLPYGKLVGLTLGSKVIAKGRGFSIPVGEQMLGRVVDAFCQPLDATAPLKTSQLRSIHHSPMKPLQRQRIDQIFETGIRAIDTLLTVGKGQRISIIAGSGVGKSTLLGMLVHNSVADVIVVALIGERGREVLDFVERDLGETGLARAIVVVATADEPALVRTSAALSAMTIAEYFRDQGKHVLLLMDSLTRFAMARREVGLASGEPATSRGYTPSVFAELSCLLERCGAQQGGGSITGLFTVLVEGDDIHDPVADSVRAIVDGHIVLARALADHGHFPAIDILASISRLMADLSTKHALSLAKKVRHTLSLLAKNQDLVELGAYRHGSNLALDNALSKQALLNDFLQQDIGQQVRRETALHQLHNLMG
jgi:flagellum-specific ATP synthase